MSSEMKLIMENWRGFNKESLHEGKIRDAFQRFLGHTPDKFDQPVDFQHITTAYEYFSKIMALVDALAIYQQEQFREEVIKDLGTDVIETALEFHKAVPGWGNLLAMSTAVLKSAKTIDHGIELMAKSNKVKAGVAKMIKGRAGEYVALDDSKIDKHPLAVIFNVDDNMSAPLKKEELENFANWFLAFMYNNPQDPTGNAMKYADNKLAQYLKTKRGWREVKPPA